MYKLGYTSGLAEANCDEGKSTIKCVGDIVDKLAKKCCDVPKKMRAPSKIIEVTNGCFSSAQVVQVCDEFGGNGADGDAEESAESESSEDSAADKACDGAAKTSGCCGGGKSSCSGKQDAKDSSCNKSCCGGKSSSKNQCTGQKLSDMSSPMTLAAPTPPLPKARPTATPSPGRLPPTMSADSERTASRLLPSPKSGKNLPPK